MNRNKWSVFVIIYTVFNIGILIGANNYLEKAYRNTYNREKYVEENETKILLNDLDVNYNFQSKTNKSVEEDDNYEKINITSKNNHDKYKYESDKEILNHTIINNEIKDEYSTEQNVKVFKVNAEEIISDLNTAEKAKILWACRKFSKDEYKQIENYLSYKNEKLGVLMVYDILEEKLNEESLEELKDIFSKYIEVDKIKEIYY